MSIHWGIDEEGRFQGSSRDVVLGLGLVVAWLSGSALVSINVVTLRRARLIHVLGCVTV